MRVLHVTPCYAPAWEQGGPVWSITALCRSIARLGHEITVFTTNVNGRATMRVPLGRDVWRDGVRVRYFPVTVRRPRRYNVSLRLAAALGRAVTEYDLVHVQGTMTFPSLVAALFCRRRHVPYLVSPRGVLDPEAFRRGAVRKRLYVRLIERQNLAGAAAVHFATEEERRRWPLAGLAVPSIIIPNGVDMAEFEALPPLGQFRGRHPETRGKRLILFLGRLSYVKGLDLLARAFGLLVRRRGDVHLAVAGPDAEGYGERVRAWVAREGVAEQVTFAGLLLGAEKLAALRDSDLLVLPSHTESFGLAAVEAMAAGLPVVLSTGVHLARSVVAAGAGLVIDRDPEAWARAIDGLLSQPGLCRAIGERGRIFARERFDMAEVARQMCQAYEAILSRRELAAEPSLEVSG